MLAGLPAGAELAGVGVDVGVGLGTRLVGAGAGLGAVGAGDDLGGQRAKVAALAIVDSMSITPNTQSTLVTRCEMLIIMLSTIKGPRFTNLGPSGCYLLRRRSRLGRKLASAAPTNMSVTPASAKPSTLIPVTGRVLADNPLAPEAIFPYMLITSLHSLPNTGETIGPCVAR
jgi:hypothetical protein